MSRMEFIKSSASPAELRASASRVPSYRPRRFELILRQRRENEKLDINARNTLRTDHESAQRRHLKITMQTEVLSPCDSIFGGLLARSSGEAWVQSPADEDPKKLPEVLQLGAQVGDLPIPSQ